MAVEIIKIGKFAAEVATDPSDIQPAVAALDGLVSKINMSIPPFVALRNFTPEQYLDAAVAGIFAAASLTMHKHQNDGAKNTLRLVGLEMSTLAVGLRYQVDAGELEVPIATTHMTEVEFQEHIRQLQERGDTPLILNLRRSTVRHPLNDIWK